MRDRNRAVKKSITPPVATDVDDAGKVPGVAPISDDGSVDSSLFSHALESEGDIWGNNNYDDASIAHDLTTCQSRSKTINCICNSNL
jgi:hypothetical protein